MFNSFFLVYRALLNYIFNRFVRIHLKCLRPLQLVLRVCRKYCLQIVEICTLVNGGNFEVDTFASDVFLSKLGSILSLTCRHSSVHKVRIGSRSNMCLFDIHQFDSNVLLFTSFLTV